MGTVSLEAARALRDMGYRPDNTGHTVMGYAGDTGDWRMYTTDVLTKQIYRDFIPTTDHMTALDWLWRKHGFLWERRPARGEAASRTEAEWWAYQWDWEGEEPMRAGDPDALIITIAAYFAWRQQATP